MKSILAIISILAVTFINVELATPNGRQTFCQNNRCITCIGRYCTTTCSGEYCENCPIGECCNGYNCNICRGEKCCSTPECNTCVTACLKTCTGTPTCHHDCFQKCLPADELEKNGTSNLRGSIVNNKIYRPVNVTTVINITNTITNEHSIHNPLFINTTNINNHTEGRSTYHRKQISISEIGEVITGNKTNNVKCCQIIHPEMCKPVKNRREKVCYTAKHQECSSLCTAEHVHIVRDEDQDDHCVKFNHEPYQYCGKFRTEDCDACYKCANVEDAECLQNTINCEAECLDNLMPDHFYNSYYLKDY